MHPPEFRELYRGPRSIMRIVNPDSDYILHIVNILFTFQLIIRT